MRCIADADPGKSAESCAAKFGIAWWAATPHSAAGNPLSDGLLIVEPDRRHRRIRDAPLARFVQSLQSWGCAPS
jgi:hypothetical protein